MNVLKNVTTLKWFNFCNDFTLYGPIAILYFTRVTGSFALGMSVFSIVFLSSSLFEIPTGIYSDKIGRKKTIMLGAIAYTFCTIFYAVGHAYIFLIIGAIFEGLGRSFYSGNNDALLYDTLLQEKKEERFHDYLGKVGAMFQLALGISALLGGFIAGFSFTLVLWLSVIPQIICIVLSLQLIEPTVHGKNESGNIYTHLSIAIKEFKTNKRLRLISLTDIIRFGIGESTFYFYSAFIALLWPVWAIGLSKTISYFGGALSFRYAGKAMDKFGAKKLLMGTSIYNRASNTIALLFPTVLSPLLINTNSLGFGLSSVASSSLLQKEYTKEQRATMDSLNSLAGSLFFGIFAFILGSVADKFGVINALLFVQVVSLPTLFIYFKLFKTNKQA